MPTETDIYAQLAHLSADALAPLHYLRDSIGEAASRALGRELTPDYEQRIAATALLFE